MSVNSVAITGVLARDPILRYDGDKKIVKLYIDTPLRKKGADGKWTNVPNIVPVTSEGMNAERLAGWLKEGMYVEVEGQIIGFDFDLRGKKAKACSIAAIRVDWLKS
jgi:single-stranded DNA-binding protein